MDNIDKFLDLFSDFNLIIEPRDQQIKKKAGVNLDLASNKSVADLKKTLTRLTKEYKQAQRSFKHNKITRQELFDFEWRIFEIQEELKRIEDQGRHGDL